MALWHLYLQHCNLYWRAFRLQYCLFLAWRPSWRVLGLQRNSRISSHRTLVSDAPNPVLRRAHPEVDVAVRNDRLGAERLRRLRSGGLGPGCEPGQPRQVQLRRPGRTDPDVRIGRHRQGFQVHRAEHPVQPWQRQLHVSLQIPGPRQPLIFDR